MQWAENFAYRKADRVVSMLPNARQHLSDHGMAPEKFVYIPNGVAVSEWADDAGPLPAPHREAIDRIRGQGRFLLGYVGGHALSNALDTLIEAAAALERQNVGIVLVGQGVEKDRLRRRAERLGLEHTIFLPPLAKELVPSLLAELDACYIGWTRSPLYRFGICPNKLLDYMMAAKPVIHAVEAANDLVAEAGCGDHRSSRGRRRLGRRRQPAPRSCAVRAPSDGATRKGLRPRPPRLLRPGPAVLGNDRRERRRRPSPQHV